MKMAGLLWMSASVLLFESCAGVTQNQLGFMVKEIWKNYHPGKMFSIAESIPKIQNGYNVQQILKAEKPATVKETLTRGDVYKHGRIVAATFTSKPGGNGDRHAEYRVLQNFDNLINEPFDYDNDFMLFYVLAAPCVQKCTKENNQENILKDLEKLKKWRNYAFVFTYLYKPKNENISTSDKDRKDGIDKLGKKLCLENVFRCIKIAGRMECRTCAKQDKTVEEFCFSDPPSP